MDPRWIVTHGVRRPVRRRIGAAAILALLAGASAARPRRPLSELVVFAAAARRGSIAASRPPSSTIALSRIAAVRAGAGRRWRADPQVLDASRPRRAQEALEETQRIKLTRWRVSKLQWRHWRMGDKFVAAAERDHRADEHGPGAVDDRRGIRRALPHASPLRRRFATR